MGWNSRAAADVGLFLLSIVVLASAAVILIAGEVPATGRWAHLAIGVGLLLLTISLFRTAPYAKDRPALRFTLHGLFWLIASVIPPVLGRLSPSWMAAPIFEVFGGTGFVALVLSCHLELKARATVGWGELWPILAIFLIGARFLHIDWSRQTWDWSCYQEAAEAVVDEENVYGSGYLYPPLPAQLLAGASRVVDAAKGRLGGARGETGPWTGIFYFYQVAQYCLTLLLGLLCYAFTRRLGCRAGAASALTVVLLVLNAPLLRTLFYSQVNLWVVDLMLAAVLLLHRWPVLSGVAVALGTHVKLQPIVLILPWVARRRVLAVTATVVGVVLIAIAQTAGFTQTHYWQSYFRFSGDFPRGGGLTDNSLYGFMEVTANILSGAATKSSEHAGLVTGLWLIAVALVVTWFVVRYMRRENARSAAPLSDDSADFRRMKEIGHSTDAFALIVLIAPLAWDHHFLLALPVIVWSICTCPRRSLVSVSMGAALILLPPAVNIYLLGACRLFGLLIILTAAPSGEIHCREGIFDDLKKAWSRRLGRKAAGAPEGE